MINGTILCLLLNILFLFSCTRYASLETALSQSYGNRSELEKVLAHYQQDESKYRAVCYLIENMPRKGSILYQGRWYEQKKVESTAIREMREEVKNLLDLNK